MAAIRLKKAVSLNPHLVEARVLLALCYMKNNKFYKANEQIEKALTYDQTHVMGLHYFRLLSGEDTQSAKPYEVEQLMKPDSKVKPHKIINRDHTLRNSMIYFVMGVCAMFLVNYFLLQPSEFQNYEKQVALLVEREEELAKALSTNIEEHTMQVETLQAETGKAQKEIQAYEKELGFYIQRDKMAYAKECISKREYLLAAETLYNIATVFLEEEALSEYEGMKQTAYGESVRLLYNQGYADYMSSNYIEARDAFETLVLYEPNDDFTKKTLYYLGEIELHLGNENATENYFTRLLEAYPESYEASLVKNYISTSS